MLIASGIVGFQASLNLADSGFLVNLVEKQPQIGGVMAQLDKTFPTNDFAMCVISPKLVETGRHLNIDLHTMSRVRVSAVHGKADNFTVILEKVPRFVETDKRRACEGCNKACPVYVDNAFGQRIPSGRPFSNSIPRGMPGAFAVNKRSLAPCKSTCPAHMSTRRFIALMQLGKPKDNYSA